MRNDPIVEEMRMYGQEFAARLGMETISGAYVTY